MKKHHPGFLTYYFRVFFAPSWAFRDILASEKKLRYGFFAALIPCIGYTLFYIMVSSAGGAPSTFKPWLAIPIEEYFHYDIFLALPGVLMSIITASAVMQLVSKLFNGSGTFEDTFVVVAFGSGVATWSTMLHDLTDAFLGFTGIIDIRNYERLLNEPTFWRSMLWTLFAIYFTWFIILFTKGIKEAQKTGTGASVFLGVITLIIYQGILLIFIR